MTPCDAVTPRNWSNSSPLSTPGLACGRSPVSLSTSSHIATRYSIVESYPSLWRVLLGQRGNEARLISEREKCLMAASLSTRPGDLEDLFCAQIHPLARLRRLGERAVVADVTAQLG